MCASSAVFLLTQIPIFARTNPEFFAHTDPADLSIALWVVNLTEAGRMGVWCCQITPSALISPITKAHTDSTKFNKKSFVVICDNLWLSGG